MFDAMISSLRHERILVVARDPARFESRDPRVQVLQPRARNVAAALRHAESVVRVGGTIFHDEYVGPVRLTVLWRYLRLVAIAVAARLAGCRVVAVGVGLGEVRHRTTAILLRLFLASCQTVVLRDVASYRRTSTWKRTGVVLGADLTAVDDRVAVTRNDITGVSVVDLAPYFPQAGGELFWRRLLIDSPLLAPGSRVRVFTLKHNEAESDLPTARAVARMLGDAGHRAEIHVHAGCAATTRERISECRQLVATRFHCAMTGLLGNVENLVVVTYNTKLSTLAAEARLPAAATVRPADASDLAPEWASGPFDDSTSGMRERARETMRWVSEL